jgi:hypothetical protein
MSKRLEPKTVIELTTGRLVNVAEGVRAVATKLDGQPPAKWFKLTQLYDYPNEYPGFYRKRTITLRSASVVSYAPYEATPNTG